MKKYPIKPTLQKIELKHLENVFDEIGNIVEIQANHHIKRIEQEIIDSFNLLGIELINDNFKRVTVLKGLDSTERYFLDIDTENRTLLLMVSEKKNYIDYYAPSLEFQYMNMVKLKIERPDLYDYGKHDRK